MTPISGSAQSQPQSTSALLNAPDTGHHDGPDRSSLSWWSDRVTAATDASAASYWVRRQREKVLDSLGG